MNKRCWRKLRYYDVLPAYICGITTMHLKSYHPSRIDIIADVTAGDTIYPSLKVVALCFNFVVIPFALNECRAR